MTPSKQDISLVMNQLRLLINVATDPAVRRIKPDLRDDLDRAKRGFAIVQRHALIPDRPETEPVIEAEASPVPEYQEAGIYPDPPLAPALDDPAALPQLETPGLVPPGASTTVPTEWLDTIPRTGTPEIAVDPTPPEKIQVIDPAPAPVPTFVPPKTEGQS